MTNATENLLGVVKSPAAALNFRQSKAAEFVQALRTPAMEIADTDFEFPTAAIMTEYGDSEVLSGCFASVCSRITGTAVVFLVAASKGVVPFANNAVIRRIRSLTLPFS
jgi:hypothetical protein